MIRLLSDPHGDKDFPGLKEYLRIARDDDLLIILGDIGLCFGNTDENREFTTFFLSADKRIAFIDGNHENFAYLNSFPTEVWNGGTVHRLTDKIVHLTRGSIYQIDGKSIFVFGGCKSSAKWAESGLWYPGEEATAEECRIARENLALNRNRVDFILTHKYETADCRTISYPLLELTEYIEKNVSYSMWYSGHWHKTKIIDDKHRLVYDELAEIKY